jgi:hypothetical protein
MNFLLYKLVSVDPRERTDPERSRRRRSSPASGARQGWITSLIYQDVWTGRDSNSQPLPCHGSTLPLRHRPELALTLIHVTTIPRALLSLCSIKYYIKSIKGNFIYLIHTS